MPRKNIAVICTLVACCLIPPAASGAVTQQFGGPLPVSPQKYLEWPGLATLLKYGEPVCWNWFNGDEDFYYAGDVESVNETLRLFANVQLKFHRVIIRRGPGIVWEFGNSTHSEEFTWSINPKGEYGANGATEGFLWKPEPTLSIYITEDLELDKLKIPQSIAMVEIADASRAMLNGLPNTYRTISGWGAFVLAGDVSAEETRIDALVNLLKNGDDWVRVNTLGAIANQGSKAPAVAEAIRPLLDSDDEQMKKRAQKTFDIIEAANETPLDLQEVLKRIKKFREATLPL
jgi:hypothetical protein